MTARRFLITLFALLALNRAAHAGADLGIVHGDGGQAGAFLDQAVSARAIGLGQAFTGVADDAGALHSNAAGLVQLKAPDVVSMYSSLYEDTSYGSAMYAQPLARGGAIGVGIIDLRSKGFQKTDINRNRLGSYDNDQTALYVGHARMWRGFGIGGAVKMVRQRIDTYSGTGYGLDLGGFWPVDNKLSLGLSLQNILAPSVKLRSTNETYARSLHVGARYKLQSRWSISGDLQKTQQRSIKPLIGTEFAVADSLMLRAGLNERELTAGMGFAIGRWTLDYAMGFQGALIGQSELGTSHRFGVHFVFGTDRDDKRVKAEDGPNRNDVKAVMALLQDEATAAAISTPTASHVQALEALVKDNIGRNRQSTPIEILQADGQMKFVKGEIESALPALVHAARISADDEAQRKNLELALAKIGSERKAELAAQLLAQAQSALAQNQFADAASASLVSLTLMTSELANAVYNESRLALADNIVLRQTTVMDALLKNNVDEAYDRVSAAFQIDPLNEQTQTLLQKVLSAQVIRSRATPGLARGNNMAPYVDAYRTGAKHHAAGEWDAARQSWQHAASLTRNNRLAKDALASLNAQSRQ